MTQARSVPASVQASLENPESPDALIWFLTIEHPSLGDPIRLVSDVFDYVVDGATYIGLPFDARPLNDSDQPPAAQLVVPNIDRRIGAALERVTDRAVVAAVARSTADFDLTVNPRTATGTPGTVYAFSNFELSDVQCNAMALTGTVRLIDYAQEPWPWVSATADRFPGLFA